jgi:hypothetical protein
MVLTALKGLYILAQDFLSWAEHPTKNIYPERVA